MAESAGALPSWESFYVIVGSSSAALIGIQFVVLTLVANRRQRPAADTLDAFATPTVVHLADALIVSAVMSVPWSSLLLLSLATGMCGLGGLAYGPIIFHRVRHQTDSTPVWQDWLWHVALPFVSYAALAAAAVLLRAHLQMASFVIGAAAFLLLLIGIHNAWDSVMHIVVNELDHDTTTTD